MVFVAPCLAGTSENSHESGLESGTLSSLHAYNECSVSNGNESISYQWSMASLEGGTENGAGFFNVTLPSVQLPLIPSGIVPIDRTISTSSYATSSPMPSNYVVSSEDSLNSAGAQSSQPNHTPKVKVWNAKRGYVKRHDEKLASKQTSGVIEAKAEPEIMAAPVMYYQLSSQSDTGLPVFPGYPRWPYADAFNHN